MCNSSKKLSVGDGDDPGPQLLGHLICPFTLIINIYGLGVGISTIIKFTSGRGWGMTYTIKPIYFTGMSTSQSRLGYVRSSVDAGSPPLYPPLLIP
jgi:hypothetical protein